MIPETYEQVAAPDETTRLDRSALISSDSVQDSPVQSPPEPSPVPFIAVLVASLFVTLVMLFGEGVLWESSATSDLLVSPDFSQPSEPEDDVMHGDDSTSDTDNKGDSSDYTDELLSTYEVKASSADAAWIANVRLATNALNGTVIPAGEDLSFNETIGETTRERGYQEAAVMLGNVATTVVGGGVSQVATALYIAARKAGLTIEERHHNVVAVDYAAPGMDASVSSNGQDLIIDNNTSYPIRVEASIDGETVTVSLYGVPYDPHVTREVTSRVVDEYALPASKVYDDPESQGLLPTESVRFYVAEVYVTTYRDGQEESSVLVSSDTYQVLGGQTSQAEET